MEMHDDHTPTAPAPGDPRRIVRSRDPLRHFMAVSIAGAAEPDPIAWRDDYGSALEEARAANRLLWIQFTGPWCPNCTRMERDSFPHPVVVQHARESFVPLKLRSDVHEQLALTFQPFRLCRRRSSSPRTERSSPFIKATWVPPSSTPFFAIALSRLPGKPAQDRARRSTSRAVRARPKSGEPKTNERLALGGYCAVSLIRDRKLVPGQSDYAVEHEGRTYRFASPAMKDLFRDRAGPICAREQWGVPGHSVGTWQGSTWRSAVGHTLQRPSLSVRQRRSPAADLPKIPTATPWSTSPSRASASTAFASRGSWSGATRATRSPRRPEILVPGC